MRAISIMKILPHPHLLQAALQMFVRLGLVELTPAIAQLRTDNPNS